MQYLAESKIMNDHKAQHKLGGPYSKIQIVSVNWGLQVNRRQKQKRPGLLNAVNILEVKRTRPKLETENKVGEKSWGTDFEEVRESS